MCCAPIKKSCAPDQFDFLIDVGTWKEAFGKPSWPAQCLPPIAFFALRTFLAAFWFGIFIWRQIDPDPQRSGEPYNPEFWAYLTNWTLVFELIYLIFAAVSTGMAIFAKQIPDGKGEATPWFVSVTWAMQGTAVLMSFLVLVLYWALDFNPDKDVVDFANVATHGINFVIMLIDLVINRQPWHLVHIFMPLGYALTYLIWSYVYWAISGRVLYEVLNWGKPVSAGRIAAIIICIVLPLFWIVFYLLFLWRRCCRVRAKQSGDARQ